MKIGDKVKFLSETGGGRIAGFQGKNIVLVEDADGFQIPTPINELVLAEDDNYDTSRLLAGQKSVTHANSPTPDGRSVKAMMNDYAQEKPEEDDDPSLKEITFRQPIVERKGGNQLSAYIAIVPHNAKEMTTTRFEVYFINDSNYTLYVTYSAIDNTTHTLKYAGEIDPNTKIPIEETGRDAVNEMGRVSVQLLAFKKDHPFISKPAIEVRLRIEPLKLYKLHSYKENDFFNEPALLYTIVENDRVAQPLTVDTEKLKEEMFRKTEPDKMQQKTNGRHTDGTLVHRYDHTHTAKQPRLSDNAPIVVDLHANQLLDTTAGMQAADILNYQIETFKKTLENYKGKKGTKLIFIHGKGEGVLRQALIHELTYHYKQYPYQDASFREYGYGATQVTIK